MHSDLRSMTLQRRRSQQCDGLQVSLDMGWYEPSNTMSKGDKVIGRITRGVARTVTNFLKLKGEVFQVIYNEIGGLRNEMAWSLRAGGLKSKSGLFCILTAKHQ